MSDIIKAKQPSDKRKSGEFSSEILYNEVGGGRWLVIGGWRAVVDKLYGASFAPPHYYFGFTGKRSGMSLKKKLIIVFIIEAVLLVFFCVNELRIPDGERLISENEFSGVMQKADESGRYVLPDEFPEDSQRLTFLSLNYGKLQRGTYHGIINYDVNNAAEPVISFSCSQNSYLKANSLFPDPHLDQAHFDITITQPVNGFSISVSGSQISEFSLDLELTRSKAGLYKNVFCVIMLFSALEFALCAFEKNPHLLKTAVIILLISFTAFLPCLLTGIKPGHDFTYHFLRIEGLANELRNGQFPVYMESLWIGDYGYPVSLYYSDILLYFPAVLRLIGFSVDAAYKIFIFSINLLTACLAFVSFRKIFKQDRIAYVQAFVYTCFPYRLIDIYVRSAVGEVCAITFLPLICAGFYGICVTEPSRGDRKFAPYMSHILDLSFGMAGVFLSHILTTEMTVFLLILMAVILIKKLFKPWRIPAIVLAAVNTVILSLIFLVPFADFYLNNETEIKMGLEREIPAIQEQGIQPGELFLFTKDIFGGGANNGLEARMYLSIGLVLALSISAAVYVICSKKGGKQLMLFTGLALFCLLLSSNLFPWDNFAYRSRIGVLFAQIQFPWRFLTFAALFAVLALGSLLDLVHPVLEPVSLRLTEKKDILFTGLCFLICFISFLEAVHIASSYAAGRDREEYLNTNEIRIGNVTPYHILRHGTDPEYYVYDISAENVSVEKRSKTGTTWRIDCKTEETGGTVTMPLNNYAGFKAIDENGREFRIYDGENKAVSFMLPAHYEGQIEVAFHAPWYWKAASAVSLIWLLIMLIAKFSVIKKSTVGGGVCPMKGQTP